MPKGLHFCDMVSLGKMDLGMENTQALGPGYLKHHFKWGTAFGGHVPLILPISHPLEGHGGGKGQNTASKVQGNTHRAPIYWDGRKQGMVFTGRVWSTDNFQMIHSQPNSLSCHSRIANSLCSGV